MTARSPQDSPLLSTVPLPLGDPSLDFLSKEVPETFLIKLPANQDKVKGKTRGALIFAQECQGS